MFVQNIRITCDDSASSIDSPDYTVIFERQGAETLRFALVNSGLHEYITYVDVDADNNGVLQGEDLECGFTIVRDKLTYLEVGDALTTLADLNFS